MAAERKFKMDDKQIMENLLQVLKGECDLMMHGALESATPNVHTAFSQVLDSCVCMQNQTYGKMSQKGWYPASTAEAQKIDTVKQKFSTGCQAQ